MNKVYGAVLSPFVRKVLMVLEYKGIDYQQETVLPFATPEGFEQLSPLRKVPAFVDDEVTLADSSVIADYLEHKYPEPRLYPAEPARRARALWLEEFADSQLMDLLGWPIFFERLVAPKLLGRATDESKAEAAIEKLPPWQDYLEAQLDGGDYLLGEELSIADLIVPGIFLNARYAGYEVDARRWPKLASYLEGMYASELYRRRIEAEAPLLAGLR